MLRRLKTSLTPDLRPLRESRDYRLLTAGALITGLGTQASLVALPYQVFANTFGLIQLTMVVGPAVGGVLIAVFHVQVAYTVDAVSCLGMALAAAAMSPQPPHGVEEHEPVLRSIASGLRFVSGERALLGSFAIDLIAMTFGMPRALFPVMALTVYHAGATGTGVLFAAVSAGATVAAITTGWLGHARYLGRIVIGAVTVWGAA